MLTDQQIEAAARKLCELRGIDPGGSFGKRVAQWDPATGVVIEDVLNWQNVACDIRAADQVREAIAFAVAEAQKAVFDEVMVHSDVAFTAKLCSCGHAMHCHWKTSGCEKCSCGISTAHPF